MADFCRTRWNVASIRPLLFLIFVCFHILANAQNSSSPILATPIAGQQNSSPTIPILSPSKVQPSASQSSDTRLILPRNAIEPISGQVRGPTTFEIFLAAKLQPITAKNLNKASEAVRQKLLGNVPQNVIVLLETADIDQKIHQKRKAKGLEIDDDAFSQARKQEYDKLKATVFPNRSYGESSVLEDYSHIPMLLVKVPNYHALERLVDHPSIKAVYENITFRPATIQSLPIIGQPTAAASGKNGAGTIVALIDSGIDYWESAFSTDGSRFACYDPKWPTYSGTYTIGTGGKCRLSHHLAFTDTPLEKPGDQSSSTITRHGTVDGGIIAEAAKGTMIASLSVFKFSSSTNQTTGGSLSNVTSAINWAISNVSSSQFGKIVAMNLSLEASGPYSSGECSGSAFSSLFDQARERGIVPVVAAGNGANASGLPEPACASGAVSVGATYDSTGINLYFPTCNRYETSEVNKIACFSNSSRMLTLLAPGSEICVGTGSGSLCGSGTSMAAPLVAGAVAILRAPNAFPTDSVFSTVLRMTGSGIYTEDPRTSVITPRLRINAALENSLFASGAITAVNNIMNLLFSEN